MLRPPNTEMIEGFIEEVRSYIPSLIGGLADLEKAPGLCETLEETHRLVHTIRGASSMVGLIGLSQIAHQMEEYLEDVLAGKQQFSDESFKVMHQTIKRFEDYCSSYLNGGVSSRCVLKETVGDFRRIRGLSLSEEEPTYKQLLASVPEHEGIISKESNELLLNDLTNNQGQDELKDSCIDEEKIITGVDLGDDSYDIPHKNEESIAISNHSQKLGVGLDPELLESFYEEAEEHLDDIGRSLNILESQVGETTPIPPDLRDEIRSIRRSVHTLKGAAAVIGFQDFSTYAHTLEDLLDWLYEDAREISLSIVSILADSSDLLTQIVTQPQLAKSAKAHTLKNQYNAIMRQGAIKQANGGESESDDKTDLETKAKPHAILPVEGNNTDYQKTDPRKQPLQEETASESGPRLTKTLRVESARIDDLVNLTGESIIALSAFDQKMEVFMEAVNDLELARKRLRKIARDLEVSYEVKALEQLRTIPDLSIAQMGNPAQFARYSEFDTLELDRYSELNLIIRTMNECAIDVGAINTQMSHLYSDFDGLLTRQHVILHELQDKMMRVRMTPMSFITNRLRQTAREVSGILGKKIKLTITGEEIELDKIIWEKITDPLMHLLRNAIDHGVESPSLRQALGKPSVASVNLMASREGNQVVIRISDDGAGLDYKAIRSTANQMKISKNIDHMSNDEIARFIFYPGFSTRDQINEVSGRGVGMDVVKENIHKLKGTIQVASVERSGTEFTLRIPLTMATIRALLFTSAGQTFAAGLNEISEIVRLNPDTVTGPDQDSLKLKDEVLPLYKMSALLKTNHQNDDSSLLNKNPVTLVVDTGGKRAALEVDTLVGQREIVIKSLGSHLGHVKGISGATVLGDGRVVPILNIEELLWHQSTDQLNPISRVHEAKKPLKVMVVDDSVSVRQVVSRLIKDQGWTVQTAKDGLDALQKLRENRPNLIILDIEMPRMNGYEFLGNFRTQFKHNHIPVVMLTSRTAEKHREKAFALGAKGFVVKPFNDDELIRLILQLTHKA